jgi:translation initiation factor IF-3
LVGADGAQIGIKPLPEALTMARELELDLVEVADKANPPVCRIMDYGKYKYEAAQRAKESRKKSTNVVVKEMKYRPKIGAGDFGTKTKKVEHFLSEGHKVKVTIMFRGREMQHPELGRKILDQVAEAVVDQGRVEVYPRLDGRNMTMVLGPDKKAQAAAEKRRQAETEEGEAADQPVTDAPETTPVAEAPEAPETIEAPAEVVEAPVEATDTTEA